MDGSSETNESRGTEEMFGECHAHIIMDGVNYRHAIDLHRNGPDDNVIREHLKIYQDRGIIFVRDGGDALGVSARAKELAPEYGIDYRTPVFAIHKEGHYGSIVGKSFSTMPEFYKRVLEAKEQSADFIKIMTTGLLDFNAHGAITGTPLDATEVKEMVHIAHEEGMAVMSHTNGTYGVQAAVEAGVDSLEHGNYMNEESLTMLSESHTVWVPTLVTVRNLLGDGRYADETLKPIIETAEENVRKAFRLGVKVAPGSDAGAYRVLHGQGIQDEMQAFVQILGNEEKAYQWLMEGEMEIRKKFCR
ncbi:amidohydrolase family protein [Blautia sp. HCN-1074]|jgi:predicted amidohydrolase YtcJ|uniref:amidohydrolase family protein n=1 Tax=Blautia sp. HCN-1074 TaxID=3134667 RepID=UPI002ED07CA0